MREIFYLTKRNCLVYLRDKSAVFFSLLSMLIVLGLMVVFLGKMNSENVLSVIEEYGGRKITAQDRENAAYLIQMWTLAGIISVNAVTVTMTVLGNMVQDETRKRIMAFYVTPVKRLYLALGYIFSAWIIGTFMCILTFAVGEVFFFLKGYDMLSVKDALTLTGMIMCSALTYSSIGYVIALFVHSNSAWSGILTIIGTLVGFAGGIYLPMSQLSIGVQKILKALPILHSVSMMRAVSTQQIVEKTFAGMPEGLIPVYRDKMGITVTVSGNIWSIKEQVLLLTGYTFCAIILAVIVTRNRKLKDR